MEAQRTLDLLLGVDSLKYCSSASISELRSTGSMKKLLSRLNHRYTCFELRAILIIAKAPVRPGPLVQGERRRRATNVPSLGPIRVMVKIWSQ